MRRELPPAPSLPSPSSVQPAQASSPGCHGAEILPEQ